MSPMSTEHRQQLVADRRQQLTATFAASRRAAHRSDVSRRRGRPRPRARTGFGRVGQTLKRISITSPSATS
jgi:hypothetical protein